VLTNEQTKVSIRPNILHRSDKSLEAPHEFHPERWLPEDERPRAFANDDHSGIKAFSTGPTGCAGKMLALAELRLILAKLIWAFDISVDAEHVVDWTKLKAMIMVEKAPMWVRIKERAL
jgi:cytochrome P450